MNKLIEKVALLSRATENLNINNETCKNEFSKIKTIYERRKNKQKYPITMSNLGFG